MSVETPSETGDETSEATSSESPAPSRRSRVSRFSTSEKATESETSPATAGKIRSGQDDPEPATRGGWARLMPRLVLAVAAGLGLALAFPPFGWAWLAPFAPAALTWLILGVPRARTGALIGFLFGLGFFGLLLKWVALTGADGWAAVVVIESLFLAGWGAAATVVVRHRWWPLWVSALWIGVEYARSHTPLGGFPWGRVAGALDSTPMASLAWLGGLWFVSFVAVFAGNLLLWAVVRPRRRRRFRLAAVLGVTALLLGGWLVPLPSMDDKTEGSDTVAIIQGTVPGRGVDFLGEARAVTYNHLEATQQLMEDVDSGRYHQLDWVLWPENSTDHDPTKDQMARDMVQSAADLTQVPILVGAVMDAPVRPDIYRQTAGIVWDPETGPGQTYAKRHPVPFGEYIPFREQLLPHIDRLQMVGRDTYPGDEPGNMRIAGTELGLVICFEIAYDEVVADVARSDRNSMLVVQSNNATWQGLGMAEQQFAITRMRAIEYGRATLVATPSGISGVIGPDGEVEHKTEESVRDIYVTEVPKRTERTPAAVVGPAPELAVVALGAGALLALAAPGVVGWFTRRRNR